ncbi:MAG: exonuclease [Bacteroidetes bacterium]|nr:exonuclease [Bacteroidota bacterium]
MKRTQTKLDDEFYQMEYGLYCSAGDFFLDPLKPCKTAVITHAHADHATLGHKEIYCTAGTAALMKARFGNKLNSHFHLKEVHKAFHINGIPISFYNAGHILGSVQVLMNLSGKRILYTGDIKTQDDPTCAAYEPVPCDVLVTECTFATPEHIHPPIQDEIAKLNAYTDIPVIIGCYMIGKAQRISQLIATHYNNKLVLTHANITPYHKVYMQQGIRLENWIPLERFDFAD